MKVNVVKVSILGEDRNSRASNEQRQEHTRQFCVTITFLYG